SFRHRAWVPAVCPKRHRAWAPRDTRGSQIWARKRPSWKRWADGQVQAQDFSCVGVVSICAPAYSAGCGSGLGGGYAMLERHARLILSDLYASWEGGDLFGTLSYFAPGAVFAVHATPGGASLIGAGTGLDDLANRLDIFLDRVEVREF